MPHALEGRSSSINIFGMQGVPKSLIEERITTGAQEYWNSIYEEKKRKFAERMREIRGFSENEEQQMPGRSILPVARNQGNEKKEGAPTSKFSFKQAFEN